MIVPFIIIYVVLAWAAFVFQADEGGSDWRALAVSIFWPITMPLIILTHCLRELITATAQFNWRCR